MIIRQGDVLLVQVDQVPNGQELPHLTLALGEVTGHSHRISSGEASLVERDGTLYLTVFSDLATLAHEEHHHLSIPYGSYEVRIQREYEPSGWRYVAD